MTDARSSAPPDRVSNVPGNVSFGSPGTASPLSDDVIDIAIMDDAYNEKSGFPDNEIRTSKYNIITFLPLNLSEQFRRVSNIFFLCVCVIGLIPGASPFSPLSNIMPLAFVLLVAAAKAAYEDWKRHRADAIANSIPAEVFRQGEWSKIESWSIRVGDIIRVMNGDELRADCLLLSTTDADGLAYIETANLDGETSLKTRRALPSTQTTFNMDNFQATLAQQGPVILYAQKPSASLASWKGLLKVGDNANGTGIPQFLPRGSTLRNVQEAVAAVVYAGVDTKMFLNLKQKPVKLSHLDKMTNRLIAGIFLFNQAIIIVLCAVSAAWNESHFPTENGGRGDWYLEPYLSVNQDRGGGVYVFFWNYLAYFVLLSFMIPISLFVGLEFVKANQALQMSWDHRMSKYDEHSGTWRFCRPKTSDLNEQLSQVRFIFTDKTGTLTENRMNLQQIMSGKTMHNELTDPGGLLQLIEPRPWHNDLLEDRLQGLMIAISVCHSIVVFKKGDTDEVIYDGPSPDEVALVKSAAQNHYSLLTRNSQCLTIVARDRTLSFAILAELDFTPERKRMSMLVRFPDERVVLLTKGADSAMLSRRDPRDHANTEMKTDLEQELEAMSLQGLRTLVFGYRNVSDVESTTWLAKFHTATCDLKDRQAALEAVYDEIERGYILLGATGVEDKLQDGVAETIQFFSDAEVVVWMLTGDKRETAVTIAATSGLVDMTKHEVVHLDVTQQFDQEMEADAIWSELKPQLHNALTLATQNPKTIIIVVDGVTLSIILNYDPESFTQLGLICAGAVCCRLTPLQKADCVRLFQASTSCTVLAIGDGANDVSMIQEARVGIGIMGLEGSQAELASDYAIPQFRHLRPLLAVHGRFSWYRNSTKIQYSFYKNMALAIGLFAYTFFTGFSGQTLYDSWLLSIYNTFFTVWIPLSIGMFDRDVEVGVALEEPRLYAPLQREQLHFNPPRIAEWLFDVVIHGGATFLAAYWMMHLDNISWRSGSRIHLATGAFCVLLAAICATGLLTIKHWNAIQVASAVLTIVSIPAFIFAYSGTKKFDGGTQMSGIAQEVFSTGTEYLYLCAMVFVVFSLGTAARKFIAVNEFPTLAVRLAARWRIRQRRL
jgi:phospholipid-transporting ATPase